MTYGAVDFLALEFQNDRLKGEILPALIDLVEKKIVRVIDPVIIQKYAGWESRGSGDQPAVPRHAGSSIRSMWK